MAFRFLTKASFALALAVTPVASSAGSDLLGGVVGGMIGAAIINGANQKPRRVYRNNGVSSAVRQERREIQTSLNHFGFPAGTPDGVLGRRSRNAISNYQAYLGFAMTGHLNDYEKTILLSAYHRSIAGGADVQRLISRSRDGIKAVLIAQRDGGTGGATRRTVGYPGLPMEVSEAVDEIADSSDPSPEQLLQSSGFIQLADLNRDGKNDYILDTSHSGSEYWCNAQRCRTLVFVSTSQGYSRNDMLQHNPTPAHFLCQGQSCEVKQQVQTAVAPVPVPQPGQQGNALTTFVVEQPRAALAPLPIIQIAPQQQALSSHCSKVTLLTGSNGGFVNASNITDANFALNEQFCLARAYSIAEGEDLINRVQGVSLAQVEQRCDAFGSALKPHIADLSLKSAVDVIQQVNGFVLSSGMEPSQLGGTAKICLATGYRKDNLNTAIGAALILTGIGQQAYAELLGHHLSQGFGASKRADLASVWYNIALASLDGGAAPAFAPTQPGRVEVLRQASAQLGLSATQPQAGTQANSVLPVFSVSD